MGHGSIVAITPVQVVDLTRALPGASQIARRFVQQALWPRTSATVDRCSNCGARTRLVTSCRTRRCDDRRGRRRRCDRSRRSSRRPGTRLLVPHANLRVRDRADARSCEGQRSADRSRARRWLRRRVARWLQDGRTGEQQVVTTGVDIHPRVQRSSACSLVSSIV